MSDEKLRQVAEKLQMTPEKLRERIIRSAYANARMENPNITIEMVREAPSMDHVGL
jgi:hypothetical protein